MQFGSSKTHRASIVDAGWEALAHELQATLGARGGVTIRHPYYDIRVIAFALGLDERERWANGQTRTVQRRALATALPDVIRDRTTKADFTVLFTQAFEALGGRDRFADLRIASQAGWVNAEEIVRCYDEFVEGVHRGRTPRYLWGLWLALSVDIWYRAEVAKSPQC